MRTKGKFGETPYFPIIESSSPVGCSNSRACVRSGDLSRCQLRRGDGDRCRCRNHPRAMCVVSNALDLLAIHI